MVKPKSKTIAIILAILLGYWTYLYTYSVDKAKFWSYVAIVFVVTFVAVSFSHDGAKSAATVMQMIASVALWGIPLVHTIMRPKEFYENYPMIVESMNQNATIYRED